MRSFRIDQFEFVDPSSEERLEVDVAAISKFPFPDVSSFVAETVGVHATKELSVARPFYRIEGRRRLLLISSNLRELRSRGMSIGPSMN